MAVGDDATAAGYPLVPNTGEGGQVRYGAREINRTRDFIAQVKDMVPENLADFQESAGISYGSTDPVNADGKPDGVIYFKIV